MEWSEWQDFHVSDGLAGPNVKGLVIDSEDNVWVATTTGVSKYQLYLIMLLNQNLWTLQYHLTQLAMLFI